MSDFSKSLCKIALPVTLQCMLQSSFSIVDQLMIGQLGAASISAVGVVSNFSLIFGVVMGAVGSVAGIIIAQFLGAKDEDEAWRGFNFSMVIAMVISAVFMLASLLFTGGILGLYTEDTSIVVAGIPYFRLVAFTFIPMGISTIISTWLRCEEHATIPLIASFGAVIANTLLNYILIFGKLGIKPMGSTGAGIATLISQLINLFFMVCGFLYMVKKDGNRILFSVKMKKITTKEYMVMITPMLISEFLWSLGQNVEAAVYGHLSTESLTAYTLTCPIQGLLIGALSGLSAAAGVMIGKKLGSRDYDGAYGDSKKLIFAGFVGSSILSFILILLSGFYVSFYQVSDLVMSLGKTLLIVFALYAPVKVENMIMGGGIIRSGGDTKTLMIIDTIGTWGVGIPLCFLAAYVFHMQIVGVYALLTSEEIVRLAISSVIFVRKKWMKTL